MVVEGCVSRSRPRHRALARRRLRRLARRPKRRAPPAKPFVESVKDCARKAAGRLVDRCRRGRSRRRPSPTRSSRRSPTRPMLLAVSATTSASAIPTGGGIGNNITPRFLKGVAETVEEVPLPERLERRTRGFGRLGGLLPESLYEKAMAQPPRRDRPRSTRSSTPIDVLVMPVMGGTALPVRRWEGRGALCTVLGMSRFYPYCVPWNHLGNPAMSIPFGFAADGMPLAVQIIGRPETSRRCSRLPPRSRPSAPGPTGARRSRRGRGTEAGARGGWRPRRVRGWGSWRPRRVRGTDSWRPRRLMGDPLWVWSPISRRALKGEEEGAPGDDGRRAGCHGRRETARRRVRRPATVHLSRP